jgi:hypothetical protein
LIGYLPVWSAGFIASNHNQDVMLQIDPAHHFDIPALLRRLWKLVAIDA